MESFAERAPSLAAMLASLFQHQGATLEAKLLKAGQPELLHTEHDNWNGGTDTYSFVVRVPVELFAQLGDEQDRVEKKMHEALVRMLRTETHIHVSEVVLMPDGAITLVGGPGDAMTVTDDDHATWPADHFRLFLSHVTIIKAPTQALKTALAAHGIAGFVAHADIEPTHDWQSVIEGALRTMDAFVALVTPDFIASKWCAQEVGIAIGRNKLVIPVRLGADPYGFMGRHQGVQDKGQSATALAKLLFDTLAKNERTSQRLVEVILKRFEHATSFTEAKQFMKTLEMFERIPLELMRAVEPALITNVDLREAFGVPGRFRDLMLRNGGK